MHLQLFGTSLSKELKITTRKRLTVLVTGSLDPSSAIQRPNVVNVKQLGNIAEHPFLIYLIDIQI